MMIITTTTMMMMMMIIIIIMRSVIIRNRIDTEAYQYRLLISLVAVAVIR
jgi:hypothetical protein